MRIKKIPLILITGLIMAVAGCSRTVEDVSRWESKSNTEKLTEALTDPKFEVRLAAAESLGKLKATNAVEELAACLNDTESEVQLAAVKALAAIGTPDTVTPLAAAFRLQDKEARLTAAEALGAIKARAAVEILAGGLNDADEAIRIAACSAIGAIGSKTGSQPLADTLASDGASLKTKIACIDALVQISGDTALRALLGAAADDNKRIRDEAAAAIIRIGSPAAPSVIEGLKHENPLIRRAAIHLLGELDSIPTTGSSLVWHQLARASLNEPPEARAEAIAALANEGSSAVPALIEAASMDVRELREPAAQTLERIGLPALDQILTASGTIALPEAREWFSSRTGWIGAPSPLIDLYAAVSILNPDFKAAADTKSILSSTEAAPERAHIPSLIKLLAEERTRKQAITRLKAAGPTASLPLIAALASPNNAVVEAAASIMADRPDARALEPLIAAAQARVDAGESLSRSSLYTALVNLNRLEAEPVVLMVRPNTARAIQVFSRQYPNAKVSAVATLDPCTNDHVPILFNIGFRESGVSGTLDVTFSKDQNGNWHPSPALPDALLDALAAPQSKPE